MSWHFLQGREAASWDPSSPGIAPSALSSLIPTAAASSCSVSMTDGLTDSQSGMTSAHSTGGHGGGDATSSQAGSPARTSVRQVAAKDLPESVRDFGLICCESLARCDLALFSRKTVRACVPLASAPSSKDLRAWGMTHAGACWELATSVRLTAATECGSLPTPKASDHKRGGKCNATGRYKTLDAMVRHGWPTPTTQGNEFAPSMVKHLGHCRLWQDLVAKRLPTPTARSYGSNRGGAAGRVRLSIEALSKLDGLDPHPLREWMMGWPIGWTELRPLATDRCQQWLLSHGQRSAPDLCEVE